MLREIHAIVNRKWIGYWGAEYVLIQRRNFAEFLYPLFLCASSASAYNSLLTMRSWSFFTRPPEKYLCINTLRLRLRNCSYNHLIDLRSHPRIVLSLAVAICDPPWCGFHAPVVKRGWPLPSNTVVSISWWGNVWTIRCVMTYWVTYGHWGDFYLHGQSDGNFWIYSTPNP